MTREQLEAKKQQLLKELDIHKANFERTIGAIAMIDILIKESTVDNLSTLQPDKVEGK